MQRLIEMIIPAERWKKACELLEEDEKVFEFWYEEIAEEKIVIKILVDAEKSQTVIDKLKDNFSHYDTFRLLLFRVEASLPVEEEETEGEEKKKGEKEEGKETRGVSREEVYTEVKEMSQLSRVYVLLTALAAVVASIGILNNDVAVIVGAMVIAPMLGPNVGLSLATTLADSKLAKRAAKTAMVEITLSFLIAVLLGILLNVDPSIRAINLRAEVGLLHVVLALAAGSAGTLAYTRGLSSAVIGVMVSLALVPAIATSGLLMGSAYFTKGFQALILFFINLICINLSGVLTFIAQGFEPNSWWEADKARRLSRQALIVWLSLLGILIAGIIYTQYF
ncbi:MAG: TIGR00341 family protein [Candidatus Thermoplasmatota archaeon]|nr:TIGR00341 family protein [Candidatus Thermoplasmatota archaeon]MBS3790108.1 TIGR00341 family protein [Candidatus Thermoplasmatota archaeon]